MDTASLNPDFAISEPVFTISHGCCSRGAAAGLQASRTTACATRLRHPTHPCLTSGVLLW